MGPMVNYLVKDFPYFRLKNPEQYIGYVVDEKYKINNDSWELYTERRRGTIYQK